MKLTPNMAKALEALAAASSVIETGTYTGANSINGATASALIRHGLAESAAHPMYPWSTARRYVRITAEGRAAIAGRADAQQADAS